MKGDPAKTRRPSSCYVYCCIVTEMAVSLYRRNLERFWIKVFPTHAADECDSDTVNTLPKLSYPVELELSCLIGVIIDTTDIRNMQSRMHLKKAVEGKDEWRDCQKEHTFALNTEINMLKMFKS